MRRQVYDAKSDSVSWERVTLPVEISMGMRFGTVITLPGAGDKLKDKPAGDVVVTLAESKNSSQVFELRGDDLHLWVSVGLSDLFEYRFPIEHLDGHVYVLEHNDSRRALNGIFKVKGLGMTKRENAQCGDLIVHADVAVPTSRDEFWLRSKKSQLSRTSI